MQQNCAKKRKKPEEGKSLHAAMWKPYMRSGDRLILLADEKDIVCASADLQGRRNNMEDEHINAEVCVKNRTNKMRIFGVCDGHGGAVCSRFLSQNLAQHVSKYLCNSDPMDAKSVAAALVGAFAKCEEAFEAEHKREDSGSTCCLLVYFAEHKLFYIANCGDSRAIVFDSLEQASNGTQVTSDHSPDVAAERKRIEEIGGFVTSMPVQNSAAEANNAKAFVHRVNGSIAVSRSFGDVSLRPYIVETPDVFGPFLVTNERNNAVLLACDGAFESNTTEELCAEVERVAKKCIEDDQFEQMTAAQRRRTQSSTIPVCARKKIELRQTLAIANAVRQYAYERGSNDNITAVCLQFLFE